MISPEFHFSDYAGATARLTAGRDGVRSAPEKFWSRPGPPKSLGKKWGFFSRIIS